MKDDLLRYCRENKRVCPMPSQWNALWEMLPNRKRAGGRLKEHVDWADQHGVLDEVDEFLRSLPESEWAHLGEC